MQHDETNAADEPVYCPYLGTMVQPEEASEEHVIPLSLGGCDAFTVLVDRIANSTAGSAIDGKLSADFFMLQRRNRFDIRGHSRQRPVPRFNKATLGSRPIQVEIDRFERALRVHDPSGRPAADSG